MRTAARVAFWTIVVMAYLGALHAASDHDAGRLVDRVIHLAVFVGAALFVRSGLRAERR